MDDRFDMERCRRLQCPACGVCEKDPGYDTECETCRFSVEFREWDRKTKEQQENEIDGWNRIEDRGWPKSGEEVLVFTTTKKIGIGRYYEESDTWDVLRWDEDWNNNTVGVPEYWMPLPQEPK